MTDLCCLECESPVELVPTAIRIIAHCPQCGIDAPTSTPVPSSEPTPGE